MNRRSACRALFLALCVLPTLAVAAWTAGRALPGVIERRAAVLVEPLGAELACESATTPRPGVLRLVGVVISDAELDLPLAECDWLEAKSSSKGMIVHASELRIAPARLGDVAAMIDRGLREDEPAAIEIRLDRLEIGDSDWRRVLAVLPPADPTLGPELTIHTVGAAGREASRLVVTRNRQIEPPTTRLSFSTGTVGVAARLLSSLLPSEPVLDEARFAGELSVTLGPSPSGELSGEWQGVPLGQLVATRDGALKLDSPAVAWVDRLRWSGERVEELRATVTAGAGAADRQLVYAANSQLMCPPSERLVADWNATTNDPIAFDRLAMDVDLTAGGVRIANASGAVMTRGGEALLLTPTESRLPLDALLRFIAPPDAPLRPTGAGVEAFARRLPEPSDPNGPAFRTHRP